MHKELERSTPEKEGVSSEAILKLIDHMEEDFTECHGIMIMRHGKVIAEGWWSPYSSNQRHSMMSASKTFTGTAFGIAKHEGILSFDEKIIDLFPEYLPEYVSENLKKVTIHHLLSMSSGVAYETWMTDSWIQDYLNAPFVNEPGTDSAFLYNNAPATLLAAILRKKTGLHIRDYLKTRLFDKIGIDYSNTTWFSLADGTAFAPGGLHCTTEDLLRLMKLYLDGGVWDGERILDKDFVETATHPVVGTREIMKDVVVQDRISDNLYGYGYMMWIGRKKNTYRAEGAFGQFGFVDPEKDLIIAITQSSQESPVSQTTLDYIWEFIDSIQSESLPEDTSSAKKLQNRLKRLSVRAGTVCDKYSFIHEGETYVLEENAQPGNLFYDPVKQNPLSEKYDGLHAFSFTKKDHHIVVMNALINGKNYELTIPADGTYAKNIIDEMYISECLNRGYFKDENTFCVEFRWVEQVYAAELEFCFKDDCVDVTDHAVLGSWNLKGTVHGRTA